MEVGHISNCQLDGRDLYRKSEAQSVREGILRQKIGGKRKIVIF